MSAATKIASAGGREAESVVKGPRGTLYHLSSDLQRQMSDRGTTFEDLKVRRRFATARYFRSPAGILNVLAIILFLVAGTLFLTSDSCPDAPSWHSWLYPVICLVAFVATAFLYTMFMLGMAEDNTSFWVKLDVAMMLLVALVVVAVSVLTITSCETSHMSNTVLGPLGLVGAALMTICGAATYIMWRYRSEDPPQPTTPSPEDQRPRVSVFI